MTEKSTPPVGPQSDDELPEATFGIGDSELGVRPPRPRQPTLVQLAHKQFERHMAEKRGH